MATEKKTEKIISIDAGYGYVKVFDGKNQAMIPSLISQSQPIPFLSKHRNVDALKNIKVMVDNDWWFVGDLAKEQGSNVIQVLDRHKTNHIATRISMITAIAYMCTTGDTIKLVTGLPVSLFNKGYMDDLKKSVIGKHKVTFDFNLDGSALNVVDFNVTEVEFLPQPAGTVYDMLLNSESGFKNDNMVKIADGTLAVLDIGFGTTDLMIMKSLDFVAKSSRSINKGVKDIMNNVREQVVALANEEIPLHAIEDTRETKTISIKGKTYDLTPMYTRACNALFMEIKAITDFVWEKEPTISTYIITGGGVHLLGNMFKSAYGSTVNVMLNEDPQFGNVKGYLKYFAKAAK